MAISPNAPTIQQAGFSLVSAFLHGTPDEAGKTFEEIADSLRADGYSDSTLLIAVLLAAGYLVRRLQDLRPDLDHMGDLGLAAAAFEAEYLQWLADGQPDEDDDE